MRATAQIFLCFGVLTQATEVGTVYTPEELRVIRAVADHHKLNIHMDGARFANAVAALDVHPSEITWKAGVDVLCFSGTKNGLALGRVPQQAMRTTPRAEGAGRGPAAANAVKGGGEPPPAAAGAERAAPAARGQPASALLPPGGVPLPTDAAK